MKKIQTVVSAIKGYGGGVYSVELTAKTRVPKYLPGQFLHLTLDEYDPTGGFWPESRVFSICSSPEDAHLEIIYSVKGQYTKRMESELSVGKEVWVKLPFGDFSITSNSDKEIVLIAGGTGISPFVAFLRQTVEAGNSIKSLDLFYGVRERKLLIFDDLLKNLRLPEKKIAPHVFVEVDPDSNSIPGRIDLESILKIKQERNKPDFYISGPPQMIKYFKKALMENGVHETEIFIDEWE